MTGETPRLRGVFLFCNWMRITWFVIPGCGLWPAPERRNTNRTTPMAKKPGTNPKGEFVFFVVVYEDGSQRSNRRVPAELLGGLEKDEPALGFLIEQARKIAEKSGRAPLKIKTLARVGAKPEKMMRTG